MATTLLDATCTIWLKRSLSFYYGPSYIFLSLVLSIRIYALRDICKSHCYPLF